MKPLKKVKMNLGKAMKAVRAKERNEKYNHHEKHFSYLVAPYASSVERVVLWNTDEISVYSYFMINKKYDRKEHGSPRINIERIKP
jgi:hypothetical protein